MSICRSFFGEHVWAFFGENNGGGEYRYFFRRRAQGGTNFGFFPPPLHDLLTQARPKWSERGRRRRRRRDARENSYVTFVKWKDPRPTCVCDDNDALFHLRATFILALFNYRDLRYFFCLLCPFSSQCSLYYSASAHKTDVQPTYFQLAIISATAT